MKENPRVLWCLGYFRALLNKCRKKSHHKSPSIWMPGSFFPRFFFLLAELTYSGWWRHKIVSFITYDCWLPPKAPPKCNRALSLFSLKSASLYHYCWCISIFFVSDKVLTKKAIKNINLTDGLKLCTLYKGYTFLEDIFCWTEESLSKSRNLLAELFWFQDRCIPMDFIEWKNNLDIFIKLWFIL